MKDKIADGRPAADGSKPVTFGEAGRVGVFELGVPMGAPGCYGRAVTVPPSRPAQSAHPGAKEAQVPQASNVTFALSELLAFCGCPAERLKDLGPQA